MGSVFPWSSRHATPNEAAASAPNLARHDHRARAQSGRARARRAGPSGDEAGSDPAASSSPGPRGNAGPPHPVEPRERTRGSPMASPGSAPMGRGHRRPMTTHVSGSAMIGPVRDHRRDHSPTDASSAPRYIHQGRSQSRGRSWDRVTAATTLDGDTIPRPPKEGLQRRIDQAQRNERALNPMMRKAILRADRSSSPGAPPPAAPRNSPTTRRVDGTGPHHHREPEAQGDDDDEDAERRRSRGRR